MPAPQPNTRHRRMASLRGHLFALFIAVGLSLCSACVGVAVLVWGTSLTTWKGSSTGPGYLGLHGPCVHGVLLRHSSIFQYSSWPGEFPRVFAGTTDVWPVVWRVERFDPPLWQNGQFVRLPAVLLRLGVGWPFPVLRGSVLSDARAEVGPPNVASFDYSPETGELERSARATVRQRVLFAMEALYTPWPSVIPGTVSGAVVLSHAASPTGVSILPASLDPLGAFLDILSWYAAVLAARFAWRVTLAALRRRRGRCAHCGYDLAGLSSCPECGSITGRGPENSKAQSEKCT